MTMQRGTDRVSWGLRLDRLGGLEELLHAEPRGDADGHPEKALVCRGCATPITREQDRIQVGGAHAHRFTNPQGIRFHIGCFAATRNCTPIGVAAEAHTWFPGHAWQILLCAACAAHLGWLFRAPAGGRFYALILDRLVSRTDPQSY
jgi:hypothetical protein